MCSSDLGAWWMAVNHVLLREFHHEQLVPAFLDYTRKFSDAPFLVELTQENGSWKAGRLLRANRLERYADEENGEWKFLQWDKTDDRPKMPMGSVGHRWGKSEGKWNLQANDGRDGSAIEAELSFLEKHDAVVQVSFDDFGEACSIERGVPLRRLTTKDGKSVAVTTVYDLLMAQYGVPRGLPGAYPTSYDELAPYTPAWAEQHTGMDRATLIRFAREWAVTAEKTGGRCTVIIGAGINHWYHANLMYRAAIHALVFCGCVGKNGGGLAHYVGQEKLAPMESWSALAFAKDWHAPSRLQNAPSWHYVHSDQRRYEKSFRDYHVVPPDQPEGSLANGHTIDVNVRAVRNGWLPFYQQFDRNPIELAKEAFAAGAQDEKGVSDHVARELVARRLKFAIERPDAPESWPRVWFIWRGNALMSSAKGHEYFLDHYLGTHHNNVATQIAGDSVRDVEWLPNAPSGKIDLVVDLNFRMDTSALYSDIVLPAATW